MVRSCTQVARGKRADAVIVALPATIDVTIIFHSVLMEIYIYISIIFLLSITIFLELRSSLSFRNARADFED